MNGKGLDGVQSRPDRDRDRNEGTGPELERCRLQTGFPLIRCEDESFLGVGHAGMLACCYVGKVAWVAGQSLSGQSGANPRLSVVHGCAAALAAAGDVEPEWE